ncbi:MAG: rhomboid family intramembrane serine protease [Anaerolineae bacterium]|nr:rhomboid family intramembrane serine protease [Anaerolineae bacterium]MCB0199874.1 rhomboid family intramembrane serine protease [Anaerolineae bacterium]MCB0204112.1 rhomboid family intramembrane serine protease [Anaerolineae bacterium]MCB0256307.1 rhomboid family intramembrane serine protease [Anaerolineae bacterium]
MKIPTSKPRWTYVLIGINVLVFLAMTAFGLLNGLGLNGTQDTRVLLIFGAQQNQLVARGDYYRLLTSMFIHIGIVHLAFNTWALYVIGLGLERLYGSVRYLLIYILSGLGGSLVSYLLAPVNVSAGASGAIFGLIGAEIAFFYRHRKTFGQASQQQLRSLLLIAGINLVFGFTFPGINNYAHIGGLIFGAALGWFLVPQYQVPTVFRPDGENALVLEDVNRLSRQLPVILVILVVMAAILYAGTMRWG